MRIRGANRPFFHFSHKHLLHIGVLVAVLQSSLTYTFLISDQAARGQEQTPTVSQATPPQAPITQSAVAPQTTTDRPTTAATVATPSTPLAIIQPQSCSLAAFSRPTAPIAARTDAPTVIVDAPSYYSFSAGSSFNDAMSRATSCARQQSSLQGNDAITNYALSWSFATVNIGNDTCKLTSIKITMRINMLLPAADTSAMPASEAANWQAAAAQLTTHEYQHVAINQSAAEQLYARLAGLSASCATLTQKANDITAAASTQLANDNVVLDTTTNHGRIR